MPEQLVDLPDGTRLEFPEGMSQADMSAAIYRNFPQYKPEPAIPLNPEAAPPKSPEEATMRRMALYKETGIKEGETQTFGQTIAPLTKPLWEIAKKLNPQQFADAMDALAVSGAQAEGFINAEEAQAALAEPSRKATQLEAGLAGAQQAAAEAVNFFMSPLGIATLGTMWAPAAVQRTVAGAFVVDMAKQYPNMVRELSTGIRENDAEKIGRSLTGMGLNTTFIAGGLKSVFAKGQAIEPSLPAKLREAEAPMTAAAIEGRTVNVEPTPPAAVPEPSTPIGIVPPGTGRTLQMIDAMMPRERGTPPPINPDVSTPIPDFQPHEVSKQIAIEPFGIGRLPVLGPLLDPRARIRDNVGESVATFNYEAGVGRAISSALGEQIKGTFDKVFEVDPATSQLRNVIPTEEGQSLHVSDVFEALQRDPNSYQLTPEQRTAFGEITQLQQQIKDLGSKYGLFEDAAGDVVPGEPKGYFPRIVTERPPADVAKLGGGGRVGAKQFFQKERMFETEREGVEKGYKYEPSIEKRLTTMVERLYRAIAAKRLADDPALGARTRSEIVSELRESYAEELGAGTMTEAKIQQIADSLESKGRVWQPAFAGKIFEAATANKLNEALPSSTSSLREWIVGGNSLLKGMMLSADMGAPFIQGLVTAYNHPLLWSKAVANSWKALAHPDVFGEYVRENLEPIREMAQLGSTVGRLPEMMAGIEKGQPLTKIPGGVGKLFEGFGRGFQTFLDVAKIEIWKASREVTPRDQWQSTMQGIEAQLGLSRMESIGMTRKAVLLERVLLLASSYYRGAINLVGAAVAEKGVSGNQARKALAAYLVGGTATYIGIGKLLGMNDDEIIKRLNPAHPDYMMWPVETETKRKFNVGFGGIHRSMIRLMANTIKTSIEHPENWAKLTAEENPLVRWYRGHAAPLPARAWDLFTGRDFLGQDVGLREAVKSSLPLPIQQALPKQGQPKPSGLDVGLAFLGMSAYPEAQHLQFERERQDLAQKTYKKPYEDLSMVQSAKITREVQKNPAFAEKEPATKLKRERAFQADQDRIKRINDALSETSREKLKDIGVHVVGYESGFTVAGTVVPLTRDQAERYEKLIVDEYEKAISRLNQKALKALPEKRRQQIFSDRMTSARLIAKRKLFQKRATSAEPSQE